MVGGIPAGSAYAIALVATSTDGTISCAGSATFNVVAQTTTNVTVNIQCNQPLVETGSVLVNGVPYSCASVRFITATPAEALVGHPLQLSGGAAGPTLGALAYSWSAPSGGSFDNPTSAATNFTCATAGPVTVTADAGLLPARLQRDQHHDRERFRGQPPIIGLFDWRPRDIDEGLRAAESDDFGKTWYFMQLVLELDPDFTSSCPAPPRCAEGRADAHGPRGRRAPLRATLRRVRPALAPWLVAAVLAGCGGGEPPLRASSWPEADALFHSDPRWLGADAAYTVALDRTRVLWLFGDTYLAREPGGTKSDALFLRNTVGVETDPDPSRALMSFWWTAKADGEDPSSFLPEDGADWFWPGGGARLGDTLLLFFGRIATPAGASSGFVRVGWRAIVIDNPDADPADWHIADAKTNDMGSLAPGTAVIVVGDWLYAYAETPDSVHDVYLARWSVADAAQGDLTSPEWWCGGAWQATCSAPDIIVPMGAPEFSVQPGGALGQYVMVQSEGYGQSTLAIRTAPAPEGPWSTPETFFRPPESQEVSTDVVYAGKGHAELTGADFVATYVSADLYFPRFVRANLPR